MKKLGMFGILIMMFVGAWLAYMGLTNLNSEVVHIGLYNAAILFILSCIGITSILMDLSEEVKIYQVGNN